MAELTVNDVDHAQSAQNALDKIREGVTTSQAAGIAAAAQVHATLALVEQQKIANIIAFTIGSGYGMAGDVAEQVAKDLGTWREPTNTWGGDHSGR